MNIPQLNEEIDRVTELFNTTFKDLDYNKLNFKPDPNTWSIAQNIEHLIQVNKTYIPILNDLRNNSLKLPWYSRFPAISNMLGNFILKSVNPDRKRKIKTFKIWEPTIGQSNPDILNVFAKHQEDLKVLIRSTAGFLENKAIIYSPANHKIIYTLPIAFEIIVTHERRHFIQAQELLHADQF